MARHLAGNEVVFEDWLQGLTERQGAGRAGRGPSWVARWPVAWFCRTSLAPFDFLSECNGSCQCAFLWVFFLRSH